MLENKVVSLSFAVTAAIVYLVCAFFFYLFPEGSLDFFNTWFHGIDLAKAASNRAITAGGFFIGLISVFIASYIAGTIFTALYNSFGRLFGK